MKMFRIAWAGIPPAFVLLLAIQFSVGAATPRQSPTIQSRFADDSINHHIWLPVSNCGTHRARAGDVFPLVVGGEVTERPI